MKKICLAILALVMGGMMAMAPVMAECSESQKQAGCVDTAILSNGCSCDDGTGSEITRLLGVVMDIMTIGVGILGVIGISIVGVQYLTAAGNEEKTRKAKRRMFEIVLGIVAYVVIYAALKWLIPSFTESMQEVKGSAYLIFKTLIG